MIDDEVFSTPTPSNQTKKTENGASDGIRTRTTRLDTDNQALKACVLPLHYTRLTWGRSQNLKL
jgi:hypothetical protein